MIKAQFGILRLYESYDSIHYNHTQNRSAIVSFANNYYPPFHLMVDAGISGTVTLLRHYDNSENQTFELIYANMTTYKSFIFNGRTLLNQEEGCYYYRINIGTDVYYSDVFYWTEDTDGFLKVTVSSSDIAIGRKQEYRVNMTDISYAMYLKVFQYNGIEMQNEEDANESDGEIEPYYTGVSLFHEFVLEGNESIYKFLLSLRTLLVNGAMTAAYYGFNYVDIGDVSTEVESSSGDFDIVNIRLKFVAGNDIITPINII
jgi:hypothetical protein